MSATELLCRTIDVDPQKLSKEENLILEAELFTFLCSQFKTLFKCQLKNYFRFIKLSVEMEEAVIDEVFIRCIINDILSSEAYTLSGIAFYTQIPEDTLYEVAIGQNTNPSLFLSRKIIELHRSVRPELYREVLKKISKANLAA